VIAAVRSHDPAVVAVVGEELVGVAVAAVAGDRAWAMRISLAAAWRHRGIGSAMLGELERRLVAAGVHRIQCLLAGESELGGLALEHAGYTARRGMAFYERLEPVDPGSAGILGQLGGRMVRAAVSTSGNSGPRPFYRPSGPGATPVRGADTRRARVAGIVRAFLGG
jgi:transitional endoplasmic reticulum ATPase